MQKNNPNDDVYFDEVKDNQNIVELVEETKPIIDVFSLNVQIYVRAELLLRKMYGRSINTNTSTPKLYIFLELITVSSES